MDVRPGYKQTEIGIIPDDWEVKRLGELGTPVRGASPRPAGDPRYFSGSFIPWLTVGSLTNIPTYQLYVTDTATSLTGEGAKLSRTLQDGTLVIVNSGARTLGVAKLLALTSCANDGIAALVSQSAGEKRFLCYFLNSQIQRLREVIAAGNDQLNLNTSRIALISVPFPEEAEQRAIAEALSDVDELLGGLDRLIDKKRDLRTGAMQRLLTGETRLPGFKGEWEVLEFGEIASIRNAKVVASTTPAGTQSVELEFIGQGNGRLLKSTNATGLSPKYTFKCGDVLFGRLRSYLRKYWLATFDGVCSTEIWPLVPRDERLIGSFLHVLVQNNDFANAAGLAYGTHMPRSDWAVLKKLPVRLPPGPEQTAIAAVLSDMDAEIAALEARLAKTHDLKQAMVQALLTGRVRLPVQR